MSEKVTPMMRQYRRIKSEISDDVVLFFRLGDFYEMFFEDAAITAPILGVALTRRNDIPMCGIPYHALEGYLAKMIRAGRKVAICDQVEDPAQAKGIVRREVTRVITPGTVTEDNILEASSYNFLAAICHIKESFGMALLDLSTGTFEIESMDTADELRDNLRRYGPSECLVSSARDDDPELTRALAEAGMAYISEADPWTFDYDAAHDALVRHFQVHSLEGFGLEGQGATVGAAGALLLYVRDELRRQVGHVRTLRLRQSSECLLLDDASCTNLDLVPVRGRPAEASLLHVLDNTRTPMGARLLRQWLLRPLAVEGAIRARHDAVECLCRERGLLTGMRDHFGNVRDLERLIARIAAGHGNARDLRAVGQSLQMIPPVRELVAASGDALLGELAGCLADLPGLVAAIDASLVDEPPTGLKDGGLIREGFHAELDELRRMAGEGRQWLAEYQAREQERTGIKLKVRHNKVFGYYIEVSKALSDKMPEEYVRKQTLVNAERFITPELKEYEEKIFGAHDRAVAMEYDLFLEVREQVVAETGAIQTTAEALAQLDVLGSLADRALALGYVRPQIYDGDALHILDGRHPVIEQLPDAERFVPNDTTLDGLENQIMIITGPNMAGKSTYIRQVALLVIMAQMGSFVPAREAHIGLVDRVFTRVGASDDLARGRSTFMVEMQETANILNNASPRSLIVLDEIGRGTSTFDGISIAWAVAEHLHNNPAVKAKTLFATHYHELTDLSLTMAGVQNYNVLVRERGDQIVFVRRIVPGGADKSYGIQVAQLAGMPEAVIDRARDILTNLEEGELGETGQPKLARARRKRVKIEPPDQLTLF